MRAFRLRQRDGNTNKIIKHRDYVGVGKLTKYGNVTWNSYNRTVSFRLTWIGQLCIREACEPYVYTYGELCEMIDGKWIVMSNEDAVKLLNEKK